MFGSRAGADDDGGGDATTATLDALLVAPATVSVVAARTGHDDADVTRELQAMVARGWAVGPDPDGVYQISPVGQMLSRALLRS